MSSIGAADAYQLNAASAPTPVQAEAAVKVAAVSECVDSACTQKSGVFFKKSPLFSAVKQSK
jgi:hypothetical protein